MKVLKFGGTSVGSAKSIRQVIDIIQNTEGQKIVVLSAFSGVTNLLVTLDKSCQKNTEIHASLQALEQRCLQVIDSLFTTQSYKQVARNYLSLILEDIEKKTAEAYSVHTERFLLAQGELISTHIIQFFLQERGVESTLIAALDFMRIDRNSEPDVPLIQSLLTPILTEKPAHIYITQGFICKGSNDDISNLQRGGSDYTASLIGAAIEADEIQIWTDIDGMHNNDPRFVDNTFSVEEVSFEEAAELAYFGAKILHPQSLIPAKEKGIPVLLKNTFAPEKTGTIIKNNAKSNGVTSIAAKDGITAIKIKSYRMLMAYGFLKKVFEIFETYKTPIDMITTSEVAVSLTIDNNEHVDQIVKDLASFGAVEVDNDLSIVCVAGDFSQNKEGVSARVFNALQHIPIRMISYGGSNYNTSLLVKTSDKVAALNALNEALFAERSALV